MNPPSEDIATLIAADSAIGLTVGTDLFISEAPANPAQIVAVYDTGGDPGEADYNYERPFIQVYVRGERGAYRDCHNLAQQIRDLLHGSHGEVVDGARYVGIWSEGDVLDIGYDDSHRPQVTVNFRLHRTESS